jgi:MFS family permease
MKPLSRDTVVIASVVALAKADAAAIGVVAPALRTDLHLTVAQLGLTAGLASGTGALCALPAGTLVDRRRRTAVLAIALVLWSLALGVAGFATGLALLAVARAASGGVATVARPVAVSLAGDLYHPSVRGRALANLDAAQAVGTALCFLLGALAVRELDWRWLFWWLTVIGLLLALLASTVPEPVRTAAPGPPMREVLLSLLRIRTNALVLLADGVGNFFFAAVASFSVLYITERFNLSTALVDALAPLVAIGVVTGILVGGRFGDRLSRTSGGGRRLQVASVCQLAAAAMFVGCLVAGSLVVAGLFTFVGATFLGAAGPCLDAVRLDVVSPGIRGRAEAGRGLLTLASSTMGPVTFGLVATALGGRGHAASLRDAFLLTLVPLALSALILLTAVRPYPADAAAAGMLEA